MAKDEQVPLYERIKFLSIFSSNLDEFFRVRMPAVLAINKLLHNNPAAAGDDTLTRDTLPAIQAEINRQLGEFGATLTGQLLPALRGYNVHLYYNQPIHTQHIETLREFFLTRVLSFLQPLWLRKKKPEEVFLENNQLYFVVSLSEEAKPDMLHYALVNIPSAVLPRFIELPPLDNTYYIAMLDDVIRQNIGFLFPGYVIDNCYSIKITRDAETDMNELASDILEQVETMIVKRELGIPTRFLFDAAMPLALRKLLAVYFHILPEEMVEGGRYHNLKDLADLPMPVKSPVFSYPKQSPVAVPSLEAAPRLLEEVMKRDILLHAPYQRYDYILRFFNEAAVDPSVQEIYITLYRIASSSQIANALISAAHNGKQVTVFVELKARFDEANNIRWSKRMKAAGVKIIYSIPGLKVHAKVALVRKRVAGRNVYYGLLATGNFNESTARFYTDHILMTAHKGMLRELELLFIFLAKRRKPETADRFFAPEHLLVAQFNLQNVFLRLIADEIAAAQQGKPAGITIKLNNLEEEVMINKLYEAAQAGVKVALLVRGICRLKPGVPGLSEGITVKRIVDRYLEHGRIFIFHNNGDPRVYLGSADWMNRNIYRRIEVCFPVYAPELKQALQEMMRIQLEDTGSAVTLDASGNNTGWPSDAPDALHAQRELYQLIKQNRL